MDIQYEKGQSNALPLVVSFSGLLSAFAFAVIHSLFSSQIAGCFVIVLCIGYSDGFS